MLSPCLRGMFFELHDQAAFERCVVLAVCCVALAALKRYVTSHMKVDGNSLNGVQLLRLDNYCISGAHTATSFAFHFHDSEIASVRRRREVKQDAPA